MNDTTLTHNGFINEYSRLYQESFGSKYFFNGGKDAAAAKRFVSSGIDYDTISQVLSYAFSQSGFPWDNAASLSSFVSNWSRIFAEYKKRNRPTPATRWGLVNQM